ncbi:MAG: hypothetical protein ACYS1A_00455 [Planctomycetota bacterium]|jgi:hypothetical protein
MGGSNKYTGKILIAFYFTFFFLFSSAGLADAPPGAEDVNTLAEMARLTVDLFMQQSFELRMSYEFNGKFLNQDDKNSLQEIAKRAGSHLQGVAEEQQRLKSKIEDYQGADWEDRYGSTGLWRKLSNELYVTNLNKCEVDYYLALASNQPEQNKILQDILTQIDSLEQARPLSYAKLLRGKVLALLARIEPTYRAAALKQLNMFMLLSEILRPTSAAIEEIKLIGPDDPNQLDTLVRTLAQNYHERYLELILSVAFLQRRYAPEAFERTVKLFPQIEDIVGSLVLSAVFSGQQDLQQTSVFEAELAVQAAWRDESKDYSELSGQLLRHEKFQTPLILYVSAVKLADSAPAGAVNLLIESSKLQKIQKSDALDARPGEIAKQAAQLAYNLFVQDSGYCAIALEAFGNYCAISGNKIDEELEYLYSVILDNCGEDEKAEELLEKIAKRPAGAWRNRARLELTIRAIQQKQYENPKVRRRLLGQFSSLVAESNDSKCANEAMELLSAVIDEIDREQADDFDKTVQDCKVLAEFCFGCLDGLARREASLYLAEATIFTANKEKEKLSAVEKLLNDIGENVNDDVNLFRCKARLLTEQGKFGEAAEGWAQVAQMRKSDMSSANQRSWKWWRAKFYELACWSKCPQTRKEDVLHTIEVLENSFDSIPPLWAEKLSLLKEEIK